MMDFSRLLAEIDSPYVLFAAIRQTGTTSLPELEFSQLKSGHVKPQEIINIFIFFYISSILKVFNLTVNTLNLDSY